MGDRIVTDDDLAAIMAPRRPVGITRDEAAELGPGPLEDWDRAVDDAVIISAAGLVNACRIARREGVEQGRRLERQRHRNPVRQALAGFVFGLAITFLIYWWSVIL